MTDAGVGLTAFERNLEPTLEEFEKVHGEFVSAGAKQPKAQAQQLIDVIEVASRVESIVTEYGNILHTMFDKASDQNVRIALLIAASQLLNILSEVDPQNLI